LGGSGFTSSKRGRSRASGRRPSPRPDPPSRERAPEKRSDDDPGRGRPAPPRSEDELLRGRPVAARSGGGPLRRGRSPYAGRSLRSDVPARSSLGRRLPVPDVPPFQAGRPVGRGRSPWRAPPARLSPHSPSRRVRPAPPAEDGRRSFDHPGASPRLRDPPVEVPPRRAAEGGRSPDRSDRRSGAPPARLSVPRDPDRFAEPGRPDGRRSSLDSPGRGRRRGASSSSGRRRGGRSLRAALDDGRPVPEERRCPEDAVPPDRGAGLPEEDALRGVLRGFGPRRSSLSGLRSTEGV
jgi:hypothetical protein